MPAFPFRIKICGVTNSTDAQMVARAGADAIGLNFYPKSKRYVDPARAVAIAASIPIGVTKVGVFVNSTAGEIRRVCSHVALDIIQLHGDEPAELLAELNDLPTIRAVRWNNDEGAAIDAFVERCSKLNCSPVGLLIDAHHPSEYGGTGITADWSAIAKWKQSHQFKLPIILAGGLTSANIAQAITVTKPDAVDTASGVESSPGSKDAFLVADFCHAARQAFSNF